MESEAVEAFFNSPMCRIACELTEDEYMQHTDALMTQLLSRVFTEKIVPQSYWTRCVIGSYGAITKSRLLDS